MPGLHPVLVGLGKENPDLGAQILAEAARDLSAASLSRSQRHRALSPDRPLRARRADVSDELFALKTQVDPTVRGVGEGAGGW